MSSGEVFLNAGFWSQGVRIGGGGFLDTIGRKGGEGEGEV